MPTTIQEIPVEKIQPAAHQARKTFDEEAIKALAESIKEEGLLQPILVRSVVSQQPAVSRNDGQAGTAACTLLPDTYELVSGERRLRATKLLGLPTIEAKVIQTVSEADAVAKGLVDNLQRQDLDPIEEGEGFQTLNKLDPDYWTQEKIARVAGRSRVYITQSLGFLNLPEAVRAHVRRLTLSRSHALELLGVTSPEKQQEIADQVVKNGLSIKQTRQLVEKMGKGSGSSAPKAKKDVPDLAWKGKVVTINRPFDPARESVQEYLAWLGQMLLAFVETDPRKAEPAVSGEADPPATSAPPLGARLPKTPEEQAELEQIAAKAGPNGVYTWLFGAGSPMADAVPPAATWEDLGLTPANGLSEVLIRIKKFQGTVAASA
jgi:ParB family chromosome partitioning protein